MSQSKWTWVAVLVIAALTVPTGLFAQRGEESVDVVEVSVPVQVLVRGKPVRGLTRDDFVLRAARKKRDIVGFREVDLGAIAPDADVPLSGRRHFVLLFDLAFAQPSNIVRAQEAALRVLSDDFLPSDMVSVATLTLGGGLQVQLGFTPDHEQARQAVASLGVGALRDAAADPLGLTVASEGDSAPGPISARGEQSVDLEALERAISDAQLSGAYDVLIRSMNRLAELLQGVDGAKHVIYLSAGAASRVLFGTGVDTEAERQGIIDDNEAVMLGNNYAATLEGRFGTTSILIGFEKMLKEFVRSGSSIQAIDIAGLRAEAAGLASGDDTLFFMANTTGGNHIRNHNDFDLAMNKILTRTSVSYVLSFQAPPSRRDGQYEKIQVKLARKIRGAEVLHRPGYHSPRPYSDLSPEARRAQSARWLLGDEERSELDVAVRIEETASARLRKAYSIVVEIGGDSIRSVSRATWPADTEIYVYVFASDDRIIESFDESLRPPERSERFRSDFPVALEPGSYEVRVLVRELGSGAASLRIVLLDVPE